MRFRLIEDQRDVWPVRVMCDALSVSPSGYYAWRSRPESPRAIANRDLLSDIRRVHADHRGRYGAPRIHAELRAAGQTLSRKRIERVMRRHGIRAQVPRRYRVCTTDSKQAKARIGFTAMRMVASGRLRAHVPEDYKHRLPVIGPGASTAAERPVTCRPNRYTARMLPTPNRAAGRPRPSPSSWRASQRRTKPV